ncbi:hypothetical protein EVAR_63166_1 [Eumeta japonica]|uniref:Uncharacterized protein n=1 Tax=Eumeta variegata TaxID=151549 RepID=A0A4C1Z476_EUMVA|nr:hypothetical protein EVAR_63166_1 [Eumeta japonica]
MRACDVRQPLVTLGRIGRSERRLLVGGAFNLGFMKFRTDSARRVRQGRRARAAVLPMVRQRLPVRPPPMATVTFSTSTWWPTPILPFLTLVSSVRLSFHGSITAWPTTTRAGVRLVHHEISGTTSRTELGFGEAIVRVTHTPK